MAFDHAKDAIRARLDCREAARLLGLKVRRDGKTCCVAHVETDPSMQLYPGDRGWHCFGCGEGGDVFALIQAAQGCDFHAALEAAAGWAGVALDDTTPPRPARKRELERPPEEPQEIPAARLEAMAKVWDLVRPLLLTEEAAEWLQVSRGADTWTAETAGWRLSTWVAHTLGCRDWHPVKDKILELLGELGADDLAQAGLVNQSGELWWPLRSSKARGLSFPVWHPEQAFPVAWRFRLYQPWENGTKTLAQPAAGLREHPLGFGTGCHDLLPPAHQCSVVVICEGEPDWLAAWTITNGLAFRRRWGWVGALGVCAVARGWRDEWTPWLDSVELVVCCVHHGGGDGERLFTGLWQSWARRHGVEDADRRLRRRCPAEGLDMNDLLQRGELADWLHSTMEGAR
jgi:hypothetical protein